VSDDIETFGFEKPDQMTEGVTVKDVINIDYLPKNKSPINNLFLVAPLFSPCSRNLKEGDKYREIQITDQFGYSVEIEGARLNMTIDFPIWSHIIRLVIEKETNKIVMNYVDFAKILGYNRKDLGKKLQDRIKSSLKRLHNQTIELEDADEFGDDEIMGLLEGGTIKKRKKQVVILVNKKIIELYKNDRFKLIDLDFYNSLDNEMTKALYLYYENHGKVVYPLRLSDIRIRMNLVSKNEKEINRQIKLAHESLKEVGYLENFKYTIKNKEKYIEVKKSNKLIIRKK
jgi:hypothetical protein